MKPGLPSRALAMGLGVLAVVSGCRHSDSDATRAEPPASTPSAPSSSPPSAMTPSTADPPRDTDDTRRMRERLVRRIETFDKPWGEAGWNPKVLDAMRSVPRHLFMPGASTVTAYQDTPYPIGHGQTISQPTIVALMTQALRLSGTEKVLEIGTGSGYQAAVLSPLVARLDSIEIVAPLGERARERLGRLGYANVHVHIGDGYAGIPKRAPFDRIILTAAPPEMPRALVEQLREGGIIVAPVGTETQWLFRWTKQGGKLVEERLGAVRFVPMVRERK